MNYCYDINRYSFARQSATGSQYHIPHNISNAKLLLEHFYQHSEIYILADTCSL